MQLDGHGYINRLAWSVSRFHPVGTFRSGLGPCSGAARSLSPPFPTIGSVEPEIDNARHGKPSFSQITILRRRFSIMTCADSLIRASYAQKAKGDFIEAFSVCLPFRPLSSSSCWNKLYPFLREKWCITQNDRPFQLIRVWPIHGLCQGLHFTAPEKAVLLFRYMKSRPFKIYLQGLDRRFRTERRFK